MLLPREGVDLHTGGCCCEAEDFPLFAGDLDVPHESMNRSLVARRTLEKEAQPADIFLHRAPGVAGIVGGEQPVFRPKHGGMAGVVKYRRDRFSIGVVESKHQDFGVYVAVPVTSGE